MNAPEEDSPWATAESNDATVTPANLGKLSILIAVIGIVLKLVGDTVFDDNSSSATSVGIMASLIVGGGIVVGMWGFRKAWSCFSIDMLLLSGAGLFLNGGLIAIGFITLPMPSQFGLGPKSVSARNMNVKPVSSKGVTTVVTKDWTSGYPIELTDKNFDDIVNNSNIPVLVDFWAPWCGPCRMMGPVIDRIAAKYEGKVKVFKLNVDGSRKTPANFGIRGIPTIILFKKGRVQTKWVGLTSERDICSAIDRQL
jgi:thioredoxin 1